MSHALVEADFDRAAAGASAGGGVLLFDGVCNLCNAAVAFVLKRDRRRWFRFASLQSPVAARLLARHGRSAADLSSLVLIEEGEVLTRSAAALRIARRLGRGWKLLALFRVVPAPLRDAVYDGIARHRYNWFGKRASCMVPSAEWRERFLGDDDAAV